ncbi:MAG: hypothetical protein WAV20_19920, partial [Blastocatellia bacterium]
MRSFKRRKTISFAIAIAFILSVSPTAVSAQTASSAFTVDDSLDVVNINVADLSDDGRWVAATSGSLRDRIGIDNHRFGDPTYVAPSLVDVWIIDTQTTKAHKLFPRKTQVRSLKWSPDGSRLALLVFRNNRFAPIIWERATEKMVDVNLPAGKQAADNAELEWSRDSLRLLLALRTDAWRKKAGERFQYETAGTVVVHSSKEPFLAWDDLRRMSAQRSLVAFDVKSGQTREVLPEIKLSSYDLVEDGSIITYQEDITKKTDYDVIGGIENQVQILSTAGGEPRTILKSTKGLTLIWSRDGRRYAYSKDGNIFVGSLEDREPRQLTGKKPDAEKDKPEPSPDKAKDDPDKKNDKEKFSVVRLSPKGDWVVASSKEGLWLMDTSSGAKESFLKMSEEDKEAPRYQTLDWSPDAEYIYLIYNSRTRWERGLVRYAVKTRKLEDLIKDSHLYSGFRLSRDGRTLVFSSGEGNRPADLYAADVDFKNVRRLVESNPQLKAKRLGKTELISYL